MEWKKYTRNRVIAEHPAGFLIIKPENYSIQRDLFCSLCESIMCGPLDEDALLKFGCCDSCATFWAYPNKDKWKEGWRPTSEEVVNKYKVVHT